MSSLRAALALVLAVCAGCTWSVGAGELKIGSPDAGLGPEEAEVDAASAGPADADRVDLALADAGSHADAAVMDAAREPDARVMDAARGPDAGVPDAGREPDVGAREPDAGVMDASRVTDAGATDAGRVRDAAPAFDAGMVEMDAGATRRDSGEPPGPSSSRHTPRPLGSTSAPLGFWEYLPPNYGPGAPAPLLVFLHGVGENGNGTSELSRVPANGPPRLIAGDRWPNERPFVVLSPQHPGGGCPGAEEVHCFIAWAIASYAIDPARVYLTGLSCGAIGAWDYLGRYRGAEIAAIVPIAGDGRGAWGAAQCALGEVPIWAFHGDADPTVVVDGTRAVMNALAGCPSPPRKDAEMTIYPGVGHDSWSMTYDLSAGHDIYAWMLAHSK